jgi:hypothetical protein
MAGIALTAAGVIASGGLTPSLPAHIPSAAAPRTTTAQVQLTDLWASLFSQIANTTSQILTTAAGGNPAYPLPTTSNAIAPVAEQVVLNLATYAGQLVSGQAGKIPGEVMSHLAKAGSVISTAGGALLSYAINEPFVVLSSLITEAADYIQTHDPLNVLVEAPVYVVAFIVGPPLLTLQKAVEFRNQLAVAIDPPLPKWLSQLMTTSPKSAATGTASSKPAAHALDVNSTTDKSASSGVGKKKAVGSPAAPRHVSNK